MPQKTIVITLAAAITLGVMFFATEPGMLNFIGYTICILLFKENSSQSIKYETTVIYGFAILVGLILFGILYKIIRGGVKYFKK